MALLRSDLPLNKDLSARFLPWIVAFMVYLAALALAIAMGLDGVIGRWEAGLVGNLTVQIMHEPDATPAERHRRVEAVVDLLNANPAVARVRALDAAAESRLLEPWLGNTVDVAELPLPDLVAVTLKPGASVDAAEMEATLRETVPSASVDDHARWLSDLLVFARSVQWLAALVVLLTSAVAGLTVVFVTRTGLAIHRRVIEIVHLIGARDAYIARQFQGHALRLGVMGGVVGVGLAALTLLVIERLLSRIDEALLPQVALSTRQWIVLVLLPLGSGLIALVTARLTVLRSLARIP
ncbi:MAG: cell division protein [Rhodospirillaceae bacterium]|nr:cell division protein [Rhodospirillaceae bacterium]